MFGGNQSSPFTEMFYQSKCILFCQDYSDGKRYLVSIGGGINFYEPEAETFGEFIPDI